MFPHIGLEPESSSTQIYKFAKSLFLHFFQQSFVNLQPSKLASKHKYILQWILKTYYLYNTTSDNRAPLYITSVFTGFFCICTPYHNSFKVSLSCYLKALLLFCILIYIYSCYFEENDTLTPVYRKCSVRIISAMLAKNL